MVEVWGAIWGEFGTPSFQNFIHGAPPPVGALEVSHQKIAVFVATTWVLWKNRNKTRYEGRAFSFRQRVAELKRQLLKRSISASKVVVVTGI